MFNYCSFIVQIIRYAKTIPNYNRYVNLSYIFLVCISLPIHFAKIQKIFDICKFFYIFFKLFFNLSMSDNLTGLKFHLLAMQFTK